MKYNNPAYISIMIFARFKQLNHYFQAHDHLAVSCDNTMAAKKNLYIISLKIFFTSICLQIWICPWRSA